MVDLIEEGHLNTVCREAKCPNMGECFSRGTATFLILGRICTRSCRFCAIEAGIPGPADPDEPERVARAVERLGLRYVVVTSVTRDDMPDDGAGLFAETIDAVRRVCPETRIEVLVPDFRGSETALETVVEAAPDVINHNVETVPRLYPAARPEADYRRSLDLLGRVKALNASLPTKSGVMLGLGETDDELMATLTDLREAGCDGLTLGQYLQPSHAHLPVDLFVPPEEFDRWRETALALGFKGVASGPFVRSSFRAETMFAEISSPK